MSLEDTSVLSQKVDLNIFSNCTINNSNDILMLKKTFNSWRDIFSIKFVNQINVFIDPHPKIENYNSYSQKIKDFFENEDMECDIHKTNGLSDGYLKSTKLCKSDYLFQLEHDWEFLPTIKHDIDFIVNCMKKQKMEHLRFNKRDNINLNETLTEIEVNGCKYCRTTKRSNNPHIIDRKSYLSNWNSLIDVSNYPKRADGIENKMVGIEGYIYGGFKYSKQINHTDGRGTKIKK